MTVARAAKRLIELLVEKRYGDIAEWTNRVRLSENDIRDVITEYGRTVIRPPESFYFEHLDVIAIENSHPQAWSVVFPLWTIEEGMSDLSVELTCRPRGDEQADLELDSIHVR